MQLEIKRKRMRLEMLKETATDISVHYDESMVQKSKVNSPFENILLMAIENREEIILTIEDMIISLTNTEKVYGGQISYFGGSSVDPLYFIFRKI